MNHLLRTIALGATLSLGIAVSMPAAAQWQWIDKSGRKVFSDQPPPSDISAKSILRQPGPRGSSVAPPAVAAAASAAASSAGGLKLSGKDKELEEKKKQAEAAEAAKTKAEEEKIAKARAENCSRARQAKATYDSGVRIARANEKGEREFLSDAQRAAETQRMQSVIDSDCK